MLPERAADGFFRLGDQCGIFRAGGADRRVPVIIAHAIGRGPDAAAPTARLDLGCFGHAGDLPLCCDLGCEVARTALTRRKPAIDSIDCAWSLSAAVLPTAWVAWPDARLAISAAASTSLLASSSARICPAAV